MLNEQEQKFIENLFFSLPRPKKDGDIAPVGFIPSSRGAVESFARVATSAVKAGVIGRGLVIAGGHCGHEISEAREIFNHMIARQTLCDSVPVHLEEQSTNTFENLDMSQDILRALGADEKMTVICRRLHAPRVWRTVKRFFPYADVSILAFSSQGFRRQDCLANPEFLGFLKRELPKFYDYIDKGHVADIAEQPLPPRGFIDRIVDKIPVPAKAPDGTLYAPQAAVA